MVSSYCNVVFMGMEASGQSFSVLKAVEILNDEKGFGIGMRNNNLYLRPGTRD